MDSLSGKNIKYANHNRSVILSICFHCIIKHYYLPIVTFDSVIVLLVKTNY